MGCTGKIKIGSVIWGGKARWTSRLRSSLSECDESWYDGVEVQQSCGMKHQVTRLNVGVVFEVESILTFLLNSYSDKLLLLRDCFLCCLWLCLLKPVAIKHRRWGKQACHNHGLVKLSCLTQVGFACMIFSFLMDSVQSTDSLLGYFIGSDFNEKNNSGEAAMSSWRIFTANS